MRPPDELPRQLPDRLVRDSLQVPANLRDFLRVAVPNEADHFDYGRLRPLERGMISVRRGTSGSVSLWCSISTATRAARSPASRYGTSKSRSASRTRQSPLLITTGYWERVWRDWEQKKRPRPDFALPPVVPIVLYTGSVPWGSNRTIADLLGPPAALHPFAPGWQPVFWNLAERTPEQLLASGPWLQLMTVMRVSAVEQAEFLRVCTEAVRR